MTQPSINSTELNYLVFRYLQESGLTHAAFSLGCEAGINKCNIDGSKVPPGALITIVQKGLQYIEAEANIDSSELDVDDDFSLLQPFDLITKSVTELQQMVKDKRRELLQKKCNEIKDKDKDEYKKEKEKEKSKRHAQKREGQNERKRKRDREVRDRNQEREKEMEVIKEPDKEKEKENKMEKEKELIQGKDEAALDRLKESEGPEPTSTTPTSQFVAGEIQRSDVTILEGHTSEVFACVWNPVSSLLASGSGDGTARIWKIPDGPCGKDAQALLPNVHVLKHYKGRVSEKSKDVTTLDWNGDGTLLATGSYDGQGRIWSCDGILRSPLIKHKGPIFSLKWNKKGDYLVTGSVDKTAIVWDTKTWESKQQFEFHEAPTLDVDWRNNNTFATGSTDSMIYVCKIGETRRVKAFVGHRAEVNAIKWDPTGTLLASCSDDCTAKIWSLKHDKYLHNFLDHQKEIYTIRWRPMGQSSYHHNQLVLATASFDSTIKLWDAEQGRLLCSLNGHRLAVYTVAFSPNGEYLASGSPDQCLHIWSIKDERIIKTYKGSGGIFEVSWNKEGDKLAACFANSAICVMDFRM